mgnify:CR=1 FL=1
MNKDELNLTTKQMVYYHSKKRNKLVAYLLGAVLGSFGAHAFYVGGETGNILGASTLAGFILTFFSPELTVPWMIFVLSGLVYTHFIVNSRNKELLDEAVKFFGDE